MLAWLCGFSECCASMLGCSLEVLPTLSSCPAEQLYLWAAPPPPQPALTSPLRSQCLQHPRHLAKDRAVESNTVSWAQPMCECVCARAHVYTYALSMPLHLWFLVVSFWTPVDLADTLLHPGDPLRQEAQLKPAWIPDLSGCKAVNAWS